MLYRVLFGSFSVNNINVKNEKDFTVTRMYNLPNHN